LNKKKYEYCNQNQKKKNSAEASIAEDQSDANLLLVVDDRNRHKDERIMD